MAISNYPKLLVSLNHNLETANMEIFDISQKRAKKIFAFEEVHGSKLNFNELLSLMIIKSSSLVVGYGDLAYNSRRNLLASLPLQGKIAYHLHEIGYSGKNFSNSVNLLRKSKWHFQHDVDNVGGGNS